MYVEIKKSKEKGDPDSYFYEKKVDIYLVVTFLYFLKTKVYLDSKSTYTLAVSYIRNTVFPNINIKIKDRT